MTSPKPIVVTAVDEENYTGAEAPQPFLAVGGVLEDILDRLAAVEDVIDNL